MTQHLESREPRDGYAEGLVEIGAEYDDVFVLDGDCAKANYTTRFQERFPDRFFNLGIAECDIVGTAAGMAAMGRVPFANAYGNFLTGRGFDQVRVSVAYSGRNAKIVGHNAGTTAAQEGATHLPLEDVAIMRALPEMTVIVPCDAVEMRKAVHAVHALDGPVYLRVGKLPAPQGGQVQVYQRWTTVGRVGADGAQQVVELVEGLEGPDQQKHDHRCRGGAQLREGDVTQHPPAVCPVECCRLVGFGWDALQACDEQDHVEPGLQPQAHRDQGDPVKVVATTEPVHRIPAEGPDQGVQQTETGSGEKPEPPHQGRNHVGDRGRDEESGTEEGLPPLQPVQQQRQPQRAHVGERHDEHSERREHQQ